MCAALLQRAAFYSRIDISVGFELAIANVIAQVVAIRSSQLNSAYG